MCYLCIYNVIFYLFELNFKCFFLKIINATFFNKSLEVDNIITLEKEDFNCIEKSRSSKCKIFKWKIKNVVDAMIEMDLLNFFFDYEDNRFDNITSINDIYEYFGEEWINNNKELF